MSKILIINYLDNEYVYNNFYVIMKRFISENLFELLFYIVMAVLSLVVIFSSCFDKINPVACVAFGTYIITVVHRMSVLRNDFCDISIDILLDNEIDKCQKRIDLAPVNSLFEFVFTNISKKNIYIKYIRLKCETGQYEALNGLKNIKKLEPGEFLCLKPKQAYKFGYIVVFLGLQNIEVETTDGVVFTYKEELKKSQNCFRKLNSNLCAKLADPVNKNYMICEIDDVETHSGWKFSYK